MAYAFDHLATIGVEHFVVNTHHLPEAYRKVFPGNTYQGRPISLRHEPVLLETGGGLANVWDLLTDGSEKSFAVYNGDILSDVPLQPSWQAHLEKENLVTLVLRKAGAVRNVTWDAQSGLVTDLRNALGTNPTDPYQFTGIYFVSPRFYKYLVPGRIESVVEGFLRAIQSGERIGGHIAEGDWWDLGDTPSYLAAHSALLDSPFPRYARQSQETQNRFPVHPSAEIHPKAKVLGKCCIGPEASIQADAVLEDCLVWPHVHVPAGTNAAGQIFFR